MAIRRDTVWLDDLHRSATAAQLQSRVLRERSERLLVRTASIRAKHAASAARYAIKIAKLS